MKRHQRHAPWCARFFQFARRDDFARLGRATLLVLAVAAASNGASAQAPTVWRGFVSEDTLPSLFSFRRCQGAAVSTRAYLINDKSPNQQIFSAITEVRKTRSDASQPLFVEFRGTLTNKHADAVALVRVIGFVTACNEAAPIAPGALLTAEGRDPTWKLVATAAGARFELLGQAPIRFPAAPFQAPQQLGEVRVIDAWSRADGGTIRVELRDELCIDAGAESAYGVRARVRIGSNELEGCAVR